MKPEELRRYAELIVRGCIAFRRGDTLLELVSFGHRDLAVAIAETAYRAGAVAVDVAYDDNRIYAAKIHHGPTSPPTQKGRRMPLVADGAWQF